MIITVTAEEIDCYGIMKMSSVSSTEEEMVGDDILTIENRLGMMYHDVVAHIKNGTESSVESQPRGIGAYDGHFVLNKSRKGMAYGMMTDEERFIIHRSFSKNGCVQVYNSHYGDSEGTWTTTKIPEWYMSLAYWPVEDTRPVDKGVRP